MSKIKTSTIFFGILLILFSTLTKCVYSQEKPLLTTKHFNFFANGNVEKEVVLSLANALETNYLRITGDLETVPYDSIAVNIYSSQWRYTLATGNWFASGHIEGPAILHFVEESTNQNGSWRSALHEFTHAVVLKLLIDASPLPFDRKTFDDKFQTMPVWLWEAVSVYEAKQFREPKSLSYLTNGTYPSLVELSDRSNGKIYGCGFTIIEFLLHQYGKEKLIALLANYGNIKLVMKTTNEDFMKKWYEFIKIKYLK
jgi:hypothetical protein